MILILWVLCLGYVFVLGRAAFYWKQLSSEVPFLTPRSPLPFVSVIIAARNEADNIPALLRSLSDQTLPQSDFEIIIADDHSTDNTRQKALEAAGRMQLPNFKIIDLLQLQAGKGKKAAITAAINQARGEIICLTDADCRPQPSWLSEMLATALAKDALFVSGPVGFAPVNNLLEKMQAVEFAGLVAIGGASIKMQLPNMCNGANLLFSKEAFFAVNGYQGNDQVASGDDEFLLHKIAEHFPGRYMFLKSATAIVYTQPCSSFRALMQQRVRWASKWKHYTTLTPRLLALLVAGFYGVLIITLLATISGWLDWAQLIWVICAKFAAEGFFLWVALRFFNKHRLFWLTLPMQVLQPVFVLLVAISTLRGKYNWKSRSVKI